MTSHTITFYTDDHDDFVVELINLGYAPMMATQKKSAQHFKSFEGEHRFWSFRFQDWTVNSDYVDIAIGAPDDFKTDWVRVGQWFRKEIGELELKKPVRLESKDVYDERMSDMEKNMDRQYTYNECIRDGIFFAEIRKPEEDQEDVPPYTIVIEGWFTISDLRQDWKMIFMFSSICSVPSFGRLYPADRNFIVSLWKYKNMEGEFNLQEIADKHVKAVKDGFMHEPVVYRKSVGKELND